MDSILTRFCFQRALGFIYLIAFLIAANQYKALVGTRGLLPAELFLRQIRFWDSPTFFWFHCSDNMITIFAWIGVGLSLLAVTGISDSWGGLFSMGVWALLWVIYLSFVNAGQVFYGFGWETLLLETGFLAIFLGSTNMTPQTIMLWLLRWVLFRIMFGAGLIKIRGDSCWRDLTCMFYHYETQPLPNPLSWYFHHLPPLAHRAGILFTHFVELLVPFGIFGPRNVRIVSGLLMIIFQTTLIFSGNLSWLNYITIVLCMSCFDDAFLSRFIPFSAPSVLQNFKFHGGATYALAALVLFLSIRPVLNMISPRQIMNTSFEPLHLVNTYGAFGSVTRVRNEIVIEGTNDVIAKPTSPWTEYEFKGKPGDPARPPPIVSPYHYKLDWQMWFAAMSDYSYHPWILNLVAKLLQNDKTTLGLLAHNPFPEKPPAYIRARLYEYHFTDAGDKTGNWWNRKLVGEYLPPLSLDNPQFREILINQGWL